MKNKIKKIPKFKSEAEERKFWLEHDASDYFDTSQPVELDLSELKPTTKPVTVRLPVSLVTDLKLLANKKDMPYQSLLKVFLAEKVAEEFGQTRPSC